MNSIVNQMLLDVLEIQEDRLAKAKDEFENLKDAVRIAKNHYEERLEKVTALKEALGR